MGNSSLSLAKSAKNDEFYTTMAFIEQELVEYYNYDNDVFRDKVILLPCDDPEWSNFTKFFLLNFGRFGIKRIIGTSYAPSVKLRGGAPQSKGKKYVLDRDTLLADNRDLNQLSVDDLIVTGLTGDGDFRSSEVTTLRDEADIVVTNPPFSLFREFVSWLHTGFVDNGLRFLVVGNMNAITYKEIFPLIKDNNLWLGLSTGGAEFAIPDNAPTKGSQFIRDGKRYQKLGNVCWFTNIEHGHRHEPIPLDTMDDNLRFGHNKIKKQGYPKYDNYDAIEVAVTQAIPSDYDGVMGVPISFLNKYCPEQFEIVKFRHGDDGKDLSVNGVCPYFRILIKFK